MSREQSPRYVKPDQAAKVNTEVQAIRSRYAKAFSVIEPDGKLRLSRERNMLLRLPSVLILIGVVLYFGYHLLFEMAFVPAESRTSVINVLNPLSAAICYMGTSLLMEAEYGYYRPAFGETDDLTRRIFSCVLIGCGLMSYLLTGVAQTVLLELDLHHLVTGPLNILGMLVNLGLIAQILYLRGLYDQDRLQLKQYIDAVKGADPSIENLTLAEYAILLNHQN